MSATLHTEDIVTPAVLRIDGTTAAAFASKLASNLIRAGHRVLTHPSGDSVFLSAARKWSEVKAPLDLALRCGIVGHAVEAMSGSVGSFTEGPRAGHRIDLWRDREPLAPVTLADGARITREPVGAFAGLPPAWRGSAVL